MKLNTKRTVLVGFAFLSICAFWQMYDNIIPLMLQNTFGLGETITGALMAVDNVLALFLLPLFGTISDKVNSKWGKRKPFIVVGSFLSVLAIIFMPIGDNTRNLPLCDFCEYGSCKDADIIGSLCKFNVFHSICFFNINSSAR